MPKPSQSNTAAAETRWRTLLQELSLNRGLSQAAARRLDRTHALCVAQHTAALQASEERCRRIFEHGATGVVISDLQGRPLQANPAFCRLLGYSVAQLQKLHFSELIHPDDRAANAKRFEQLRRGKIPSFAIENRYRTQSGAPVWVHKAVSLLRDATGQPTHVITLVTDITARKVAEAALAESEARFRTIFEAAADGMFLSELETGKFSLANPACLKMLGYSLREFQKLRLADLYPKQDLPLIRRELARLRRGDTPPRAEIRFRCKDGRFIVTELSPTKVRLAGKDYVLVDLRDVTERKEAELLRARLAAIVNSSTDAISAMDLRGIITDWTGSAQRLYGYSAAEAIGQPIGLIVPPDKRGDIPLFLRKLRRGKGFSGYETERIAKDGRRFPVSISISPVRDATGQIIASAAITRDITERKRLEAEVLRVAELERDRLGRDLHDGLSQHLTAMAMCGEALEARLRARGVPEAGEARRLAGQARQAGLLTHDLARALYPASLHLNGLTTALQELAAQVSGLFRIDCRFSGPINHRLADANLERQLYRIAQEAASNAAKHSRGRHIRITLRHDRRLLTLRIRDDGVGIPSRRLQEHDLGLSIIKYRAGLMGATLAIRARPGRGTTVTCQMRTPS